MKQLYQAAILIMVALTSLAWVARNHRRLSEPHTMNYTDSYDGDNNHNCLPKDLLLKYQ